MAHRRARLPERRRRPVRTSTLQPDTLVARLREHLATSGLFTPPGHVLVAVSGGTDSAALLCLLQGLADDLAITLAVAHVDHGIHADSREWAARVAALAREFGLPFVERRMDLGSGTGETRARAARYDALRAMQAEVGATYLATAHHADDQAETVLFRVLRGSGPTGLAGIPARGPGGLRRPLLPFTRDELRAWLAAAHPHVRAVVDTANADERHDRVWIRRVALPFLRARVPAVDDALRRTARQAGANRRAWEALLRDDPAFGLATADGWVEVERAPFSGYHNVLSVALLRSLCGLAGCRLRAGRSGAFLRFVRQAPSGRVFDLGDGWTAETVFGRVRVAAGPAGQAADVTAATWGDPDVGETRWGEWGITWRREPAGQLTRMAWSTWVLGDGGEVRAARPGDVVRPLGGIGRRAVRRLLMEARVPRAERRRYPVVARGERILWVPGVCRGEVALPRPGQPAVRLDVRRLGDP